MKQKFAQAVRILTTPPVFSALMCTLLYVLVPGSFASLGHYLLAIVCLSLLPVLAYPVSYLIPALRRGGRKTQRNLALVFSVLGYLIGFLAAVLDDGAAMEKVVFGTYLISGTTLAVCDAAAFQGQRPYLRLLRPDRGAVDLYQSVVSGRLCAPDADHLVEHPAQASHGAAASCGLRHPGAGYADLPGAIPVNRESQRTGSTSVRADFYATAKSTHREDPHHAVHVKL